MIVLDEQLIYKKHRDAIARWYSGQVTTITALRPHSVIKDDSIPALLVALRQPTFVTINVKHFWRIAPAHQRYCMIGLELQQNEAHRVPVILREILQHDAFRSKASRMGKVIRWRAGRISFYSQNQRIITLKE